ncbi:Kinase-like protein [Pleurostoma richardsiae]|uniref:Kinase-like protein n=1 Tax=Pleurostoma richardsiae TaxID=41990 RepID=A0AA38RQ59_9PEZI|nr:Kinase-like protein [Pleurostoma richardsiae]
MAQQNDLSGLKWVRTLWGLEPRWTSEPDERAIEETVRNTLNISPPCKAKFLAQGAFNKLYIVESSAKDVVARVTLPIEPTWKTLSEVATLRWVAQNTSLPVPRVLAYNADRSNPIGFEWIIMEKMPGKPWADAWRDLSMPAKQDVVRQIARFCSDTFQNQMRGIGSLFPDSNSLQGIPLGALEEANLTTADTSSSGSQRTAQTLGGIDSSGVHPKFCVQKMISTSFITASASLDVPRGPFQTSRQWLTARLDLAEADYRRRLSLVQKRGSGDVSPGTDLPAAGEAEHGSPLEAIGRAKPGAAEGIHPSSQVTAEEETPGTTEAMRVATTEQVEGQGDGEDREKLHKDTNDTDHLAKYEDGNTNDIGIGELDQDEDEAGEASDDDEDTDSEEEDEEEDPEDLGNSLTIVAKLREQLDNFFPCGGPEPEPTVIFHDDLNRHNILIDEKGALAAVVDWECISALPLPVACQYPAFLQGKPNHTEPIKSQYQHDENGEVNELYWEHLEFWELTQLRRFFLDEMRKIQPRWVDIFASSQRQRDYVLAVEASDDVFMLRRLLSWLNDLESGAPDVQGLEERIDSASL